VPKDVEIPYQGKLEKAEELQATEVKEGWSEYTVEDGSTIRVRSVIGRLVKLRDIYSDSGEPIYLIRSSTVMSGDVPPHLMKKKSEP
jgi:hypothetical protein